MTPNYSYDLPSNYYFGGGGDSFATPLAVIFLVLAIILIFSLQRRYAVVPFVLAGLLIPASVSLVIGAFHFNAQRILVLAGWLRLLVRREQYPARFNALDKVIVYSALVSSVDYVLVWREYGAVVNKLGYLVTAVGSYLLLRSLIRSKEDVLRVIKVLACVMVIIAPMMWHEHQTQHNGFSVLGAPAINDNIRDGKVRARGPFEASIVAGTIGVVSIPLFVGLWWYGRGRLFAACGVTAGCVMMVACTSSTPVMSLPAGILALAMWHCRDRMRTVRRMIVALLACLQLEMWIHSRAPVWFAIDRVSGFLGGSGYHRAMLIDYFVRRFSEWFVIGTNNNANWGWSMWDVDNGFVGAGLNGGLLGFVLFLYIFIHGYRTIGKAWRAARKSRRDARLVWAIGAALFANTTALFGIVYFDQSVIAWYVLLVMIQVTIQFSATRSHAVAGQGALQREAVELPSLVCDLGLPVFVGDTSRGADDRVESEDINLLKTSAAISWHKDLLYKRFRG